MTIRALVTGVLMRDPDLKAGKKSGRIYSKAMVKVDAKVLREGDPDSLICWLTAFGSEADLLATKRKGDSIAVAGRLDIRATLYNGAAQASVSVTVDKLIDATRPARKPKDDAPTTNPVRKAESETLPDVRGEGVAELHDDVLF